ncbi:hypothetical protein OPQ81_000480 [Rhizoctonia solani]|nr:hypothetical protein OPQ81_000480 [Rhizoctonia solani]
MSRSGQEKPDSHPKSAAVDGADVSKENIRTLASTKYFDDWSGHGVWSIVIANRAVGDLRQMRKGDGHVFRMVSKKIKELSQGFFSDDNQKRLVGLKTEVPIYEAKVSRDLRIVYQIDLDTDVEAKVDKQIIKLYGIYTHAKMDNRLWSMVSYYHATRRGKEYQRRCSFRETPRTLGNNVTLPAQFPHEEDIEVPIEPQANETMGEVDTKDEDFSAVRSLVASEKFMLMSKSLVKSIVDDSGGGHVFQVSAKEKEVIYYDSACFVLGRSGTGKTTCIVFKMLGIEKMFEWAEEGKPRQVFITQSPELAQRVQEYYWGLVETDSGHSTLSKQNATDNEPILADLRDENVESFGLPSRYSLLEDKHFPLFLTFDQLCSLLEEDYKYTFGRLARLQASAKRFDPEFRIEIEHESKHNQAYINDQLLPAVLKMDKIKENKHAAVTFEVFAIAYWPHFDQRLTKDLDPALVYSEFLGVIEGSELTLTNESGVLSRSQYLELGHGNSLLFSQRDRIYNLYESYRKARGKFGGFDAAERTHALIVATQDGKRIPGPKIDALYVDEAQDNLLIDTKLMRNLSNNPHGILMAGDTAQTISAGSSFRFEDLKAFSWRLENQDEAVRTNKRKPIHPILFHLSVNYRSHGGIVDCASIIVELVSELFPNSIDKLKRETGLIGGPRPTFFSGWEHSSIPIKQFLRDQADIKIDFGANQVILVRNDAARNALRAQVGEIGLILTLYESKGLEFNDVLLYNFFEDSVASATTWRVVLNALGGNKYGPLPQFEEVRHAVVCTELKNLYVGLTRARNHCWILDVSKRAEPMKVVLFVSSVQVESQFIVQLFWTERNLIEHCGPGNPIPQLSASSSKAEWEERGRSLFERQLYPQAILCFERAGLTLERDISAAYEARKQSRLLQASNSNERESRTAFRDAAEKFLECGNLATSRQQNSCYLRAADCFVQAEDWKLAAETFVLAREFSRAAKNFRYAGCFAEAVDIVKTHQEDIQESVAEEIIKVARLEYLRTAQYDQAEELFEDLDEQLGYMADCGLDSGRIHVLEQHQRHEEAAEVAAEAAFDEGNIISGVLLLQSSNEPKLLRRAIEKALEGLWILFPCGQQTDSADIPAADVLIHHLTNATNSLTEEELEQLEVFRVIREGDLDRIESLAQSHSILASNSSHRSMLSLLCFSRNSSSLIPSGKWSIQNFINTAKLTWKYLTQLFLFARTLDMSKLSTQRLLGVGPVGHKAASTESSEGGFRVYSTSPLFSRLKHYSPDTLVHNDALNITSLTLNEHNTRRLALDTLYSVLRAEVLQVHEAAISPNFQVLYPCLDFAVFGKCKRPTCGRQHVNSFRLSENDRQASFNLRARALIIQIHLMDKYNSCGSERRRIRRIWMYKMHEVLMPLFPSLGGQALFELDPFFGAKDKFLSDVLTTLDLVFHVDGKRLDSYAHRLHSSRLVKTREDLVTSDPGTQDSYSIIHHFIDFYHRKYDNIIQRVLRATKHVLLKGLAVEANSFVHLLEFVGREIIVQYRRWFKGNDGIFDHLLVPRSWALDLVKRAPLINQKGIQLMEYLGILYRTLEILRQYIPELSPLYSFSGKGGLNLLGRGILILRICRLIVLVSNNIGFDLSTRNQVRLDISNALSGPGEIHNFLCNRLIQNRSWEDLEDTIIRCPLNRGPDQLVRLFLHRGNNYPQPRSNNFVRAIGYSRVPEIENLLSLTRFAQRPQLALNPEAESFGPSNPIQSPAGSKSEVSEFQEELDVEDGDTSGLMQSDRGVTSIHTLPQNHSESEHSLTPDEFKAGTKILMVLRQYVLRKQAQQRSAVETIWKCYSRYQHRRNAARSAADERYIKFQHEYKKDIMKPEDLRSLPGSFYRHKAILLGCMPHVAAYLRGLEHVNQLQKHANRKRLQTAHHKELEEIQTRMDACSKFTTVLKKLVSAIMPGSKELQDLTSLQVHIKELGNIYGEMEQEFGRDVIPASLEQHRHWGLSIILAQSI